MDFRYLLAGLLSVVPALCIPGYFLLPNYGRAPDPVLVPKDPNAWKPPAASYALDYENGTITFDPDLCGTKTKSLHYSLLGQVIRDVRPGWIKTRFEKVKDTA